MATEKRLIDANAYVDELKWLQEQVSSASAIEIQEYIDRTNRQPTVDAVEVVRCENCQYWNPRYETMGMCMKHNSIVTFTKPDFYCACGKEKNNGICKED